MRNILTLSRNLIYPPRCPWCDGVLPPEYRRAGCCGSCAGERTTAADQVCFRCGKHTETGGAYCLSCIGKQVHFLQNKAVYIYTGRTKAAVYRFKYSNRRCYARTFAKDAVEVWGKWIKGIHADVITSVPLFLKKERDRGYNQAAVFSKEISRLTGIPVREDLVVRTKETPPLKGLDPMQRKHNLKDAFAPGKAWQNPQTREKLQGCTVLLTDDIYTTGTSLDLTAQALLQAGAGCVYTLTISVTE